jgi:hypothetical protein
MDSSLSLEEEANRDYRIIGSREATRYSGRGDDSTVIHRRPDLREEEKEKVTNPVRERRLNGTANPPACTVG